MAQVLAFQKGRPQTDESLIATLEGLLAKARLGEIRALIHLTDSGDGQVQFGLDGDYRTNPVSSFQAACTGMFELCNYIKAHGQKPAN